MTNLKTTEPVLPSQFNSFAAGGGAGGGGFVSNGVNGVLGSGAVITASYFNDLVNRIAALENVISNPDNWEVYIQGFKAGQAAAAKSS